MVGNLGHLPLHWSFPWKSEQWHAVPLKSFPRVVVAVGRISTEFDLGHGQAVVVRLRYLSTCRMKTHTDLGGGVGGGHCVLLFEDCLVLFVVGLVFGFLVEGYLSFWGGVGGGGGGGGWILLLLLLSVKMTRR